MPNRVSGTHRFTIWRPGMIDAVASVYDAAGGTEGLIRVAEAWHSRVMGDEVVSHAFSHGFHPQHSERLAAYWAEALGGPTIYSDSYGDETSVVRIHSGNGVHEEMDRRRSRVSTRPWRMSAYQMNPSGSSCTTISRGLRRRPCLGTTTRRTMSHQA
jgi:hypothetical protein